MAFADPSCENTWPRVTYVLDELRTARNIQPTLRRRSVSIVFEASGGIRWVLAAARFQVIVPENCQLALAIISNQTLLGLLSPANFILNSPSSWRIPSWYSGTAMRSNSRFKSVMPVACTETLAR